MPFTDYRFLVFLLPAATGGFWLARRYASDAAAQAWLLIASAVFCAWTSPTSLAVLAVSALFHYRLSRTLAAAEGARRRAILILGLVAGVSALVVFDAEGAPVLNRKLRRAEVLRYFEKLPPCRDRHEKLSSPFLDRQLGNGHRVGDHLHRAT